MVEQAENTFFLWSAPVAFRRVLETPEWTSRDSNHHRQSVCMSVLVVALLLVLGKTGKTADRRAWKTTSTKDSQKKDNACQHERQPDSENRIPEEWSLFDSLGRPLCSKVCFDGSWIRLRAGTRPVSGTLCCKSASLGRTFTDVGLTASAFLRRSLIGQARTHWFQDSARKEF